jgi:hypothetical protein
MEGMPSIEDLIQSIDARIQAANGEIASLQNARSALVSNDSRVRPSRKPSAKRTPRPKANSANEVLLADDAERILSENGGLTTAALAVQAGADRNQVLDLLRSLENAGRVRRTGQRRTTRWHAITDEDRIRERAAELASRSRQHNG